MKKAIYVLALLACAAAHAMPLGLRTAVWNIAAANGRTELEQLLPAGCEESQLAEIMEAFSDPLLVAHVTNKTVYAEFREWALGSGARADALTSSQMAWKSFALAAAVLAAMPDVGDLMIDEINLDGEEDTVEIVFSLDNVRIGQAALEERLKTVFGVEGATTPNKGAFSSESLSLSLSPTDDGRVKAIIEPRREEYGRPPPSFFMRVNMK